MLRCTAYSTTVWSLDKHYDQLVAACHAQAISHIGILAGIMGKLLGTPEQLSACIRRLARDGITVWANVFGVDCPAMGRYYNPDGTPPATPIYWRGSLIVADESPDNDLLPPAWQYAVN